jgi:hypothetical protein
VGKTAAIKAFASLPLPTGREGKLQAMRLMFGIWVAVLIAGIVFFSIVGLSHR